MLETMALYHKAGWVAESVPAESQRKIFCPS